VPKQYPFLVNPLNHQNITFKTSANARLKSIFEILQALLSERDSELDLILSHLNSLLTEMNTAYFVAEISPADEKLSQYIRFKLFIEDNFSSQLPISEIATHLGMNTNSLYALTKRYSGLSPKEYLTGRLILEAKRRLFYSESSIKELAFDLGFNVPNTFPDSSKRKRVQRLPHSFRICQGNKLFCPARFETFYRTLFQQNNDHE